MTFSKINILFIFMPILAFSQDLIFDANYKQIGPNFHGLGSIYSHPTKDKVVLITKSDTRYGNLLLEMNLQGEMSDTIRIGDVRIGSICYENINGNNYNIIFNYLNNIYRINKQNELSFAIDPLTFPLRYVISYLNLIDTDNNQTSGLYFLLRIYKEFFKEKNQQIVHITGNDPPSVILDGLKNAIYLGNDNNRNLFYITVDNHIKKIDWEVKHIKTNMRLYKLSLLKNKSKKIAEGNFIFQDREIHNTYDKSYYNVKYFTQNLFMGKETYNRIFLAESNYTSFGGSVYGAVSEIKMINGTLYRQPLIEHNKSITGFTFLYDSNGKVEYCIFIESRSSDTNSFDGHSHQQRILISKRLN